MKSVDNSQFKVTVDPTQLGDFQSTFSYFNYQNDLARLQELGEALENFENLALRITNDKGLATETSELQNITGSTVTFDLVANSGFLFFFDPFTFTVQVEFQLAEEWQTVTPSASSTFEILLADKEPWVDDYSLVLTQKPLQDVTVNVSPVPTRATRGELFSNEVQVATSLQEVVFTTTTWNVPQGIGVKAVDDSFADGGDTKAFAQRSRTLGDIQGPLLIDGFGGNGSIFDFVPVLLPGETDVRETFGAVVDSARVLDTLLAEEPDFDPSTQMLITFDAARAARVALDLRDFDVDQEIFDFGPSEGPERPFGLTFEITEGAGSE